MASFYENISGYTVTNTDKAYFTDIEVSNTITVGGDVVDLTSLANLVDTPVFSGVISSQGLDLADDKYIRIGTGNDLEIFHDGSNSYIKDSGTGDLKIQGQNVAIQSVGGNNIFFANSEAAFLDWRGASGAGTKLQTTATGINVTGTVTADKVKLGNNEFIELGNNSELKLHFNGTDSYIAETGSGNLRIAADDFRVQNGNATVTLIQANEGGSTALHWGGGTNTGVKLETKQSGVDVSGDLDVTGTVTADGVSLGDNEKIQLGASQDLEIYHNGTDSYIIEKGTGDLNIQSNGADIKLFDDANNTNLAAFVTGGAAKLYWAGNNAEVRLATTEAGIDVTGTVTADGVTLGNDEKITFGAESDGKLEIYEATGGNGVIEQTGSGDIVVKGANGSLRNDSNDAVIAWSPTYATLAFRGPVGAGVKLTTLASGIDVTGGFTADYIDLTGGESTTTTGTIACKMIVLDDLSTTQNDASTIFTEASGTTSSLVISQADDVADKIKLRVGSAATLVDALTVSTDGIDVTGTVDLDNLTIATAQGTAGQVLKSTGSGIEWANDAGGSETLAQTLALGNTTGGTDIELTAGDVIVGQQNNPLGLKNGFNGFVAVQTSDGFARVVSTETDVALYYGANSGVASKVLETTATGIEVTGDTQSTGFTGQSIRLNNSDDTNFEISLGGSAASPALTINELESNNAFLLDTTIMSTYAGNFSHRYKSGKSQSFSVYNSTTAAYDPVLQLINDSVSVTGSLTVNGPLIATNDYHQFKSTNTNENTMPLIEVFRDKAITGNGSDPLGGFVFTGRNEDDRKVSYGSFYCNSSVQQDDGEQKASLVFTVADGSGAVDPFNDYTNGSFNDGHVAALNIGADYFITNGYLRSDVGELKLGAKQSIFDSPDTYNDQSGYDLHMPNASRAKVMSIGGIGPLDSFVGANKSVAQMLQYRGQHMVASGGPFEFELPACVASSTISTSTANVGDIWQISNVYGSAITIDRDGSGTTQNVYHFPSLTLTAFTNNPTLAVGGTMMLQAVAANTWMIFNPTGLTDA
jgi:hypothetical protein